MSAWNNLTVSLKKKLISMNASDEYWTVFSTRWPASIQLKEKRKRCRSQWFLFELQEFTSDFACVCVLQGFSSHLYIVCPDTKHLNNGEDWKRLFLTFSLGPTCLRGGKYCVEDTCWMQLFFLEPPQGCRVAGKSLTDEAISVKWENKEKLSWAWGR